MPKELDKEQLIQKVQNLPKEYWLKRFKTISDLREEKEQDLEAEFLYLFSLIQAEIIDLVESFAGRFDSVTQYNTLSRGELTALKKYLSDISNDMAKEDIEFDKDIARKINGVNTRTKQIDALCLKISAKLSYLYGVINKRLYLFMGEISEDFYYRTIYEIVRAVGYDGDGINDIEMLTIATLLSQTYRATGETFDDVIWRLGRTFDFDAQTLLKRGMFLPNMPTNLTSEQIGKMFGSKFKELQRNYQTDTTFFGTKAQEEAFTTMEIEEVIYTAILDERTSEFCQEADGNIIPVDQIEPWVNAPPLHYYCRSWLTPIVKIINWLTGDIEEVESDFGLWYDRHWGNK